LLQSQRCHFARSQEADPVPVFRKQDRAVTGVASFFFAIIAVILAFAAIAIANNAKSSGASTNGVQVTLTEFAITPQMISVPEGGKLVVTNGGTMEHNFTINADYATTNLKPGESATLDLKGLKAGTYDAQCSVPGHAQAGMTAMVHVGTSAGAAAATGTAKPSAEEIAAMDAIMKRPTDAYVAQLKNGANTKGVGNVPLKPKVLADGTKEFDLTAKIVDWEVSPGKTVKAWTYNGMVPGPWIQVNVGDKVKVVLDNELPESTVIHFHGIELPNAMDGVPDITQPPVKPGEKFTYSFTAKGPELGMYHSHDFAQHQVPDGMLGVFQIGDPPLPAGTGPITQQIPMVLNDAGVIGLSINGKSFPATAPVMAKVGEWVEINYFNEGLQIHPMHLHGLPQLVIGKDGFPLPNPYMVDTLAVAPGERYTVLVHPTADFLGPNNTAGVWAFHCHILTHAETNEGMFGMVTTFIVTP
jgi:FtsP/CotA-like multicopper oxidase with cupredoxin domain/plastocyanin